MKNIIIIICCLLSTKLFCQTTDSTETIKSFQYRISFEQSTVMSTIENDLFDIFKTKVVYNKDLNQFIFTSNEDIDEFLLRKNMYNQQIKYFKKVSLNL